MAGTLSTAVLGRGRPARGHGRSFRRWHPGRGRPGARL